MILGNGCTVSRTNLLVRENTRAGGYLYHVQEDTYIRPLRHEKGTEQRPILHRNCSISDKNPFTYSPN